MGNYIYSDHRTIKVIPLLLEVILEFVYGPCLENQILIGKKQEFIRCLNKILECKDLGNYSGFHTEVKAQLNMLAAASDVLLAVADIKDSDHAKETLPILINELNIENLVEKMVDIYIFKIGGTKQIKYIYDHTIVCNHFG